MRDCYKILGVSHTASAAEIRRAYRLKAKILHPDISHEDSEAFRELAEAYKTLSDAKSRSLFDEKYNWSHNGPRFRSAGGTFDYRTWLLEQGDDECLAKLIFFDLIHSREDDAVAEFKKMNMERPSFKLQHWFSKEDFMDYGFILTEELVMRQEYYDAVILLEQIMKMEFKYNYFKFFFEEVQALARHVLRNNIEHSVNTELAIDAWERALELKLGKNDDAFFLNKLADAYENIGDNKTAAICREEAIAVLQQAG